MAKRSTSLISVLILILLVVVAIGAISKLTNGFSSDIKNFVIKRNGETIYNDVSGLEMRGTEKYSVERLGGSVADYEVKIYAYGTEETDFTFRKGEEDGYSWLKNVVNVKGGTDFTEYFSVKKTDEGFTVTYTSLQEIVDAWSKETKITIPDERPKGDNFVLTVTSGNSVINLKFSISRRVREIVLNTNNIVF